MDGVKQAGSIGRKLVLYCLFAVLVVAALQFFIFNYLVSETVNKNSLDFFTETVYQISRQVSQYQISSEQTIKSISGNFRIASHLKEARDSSMYDISRVAIMREVLRTKGLQSTDNIYIFAKSLPPINCYYSTPVYGIPEEYVKYLDYSAPDRERVIWKVDSDESYRLDGLSFLMVRGELVGLVLVTFDGEMLEGMLSSTNKTESSNIYIVDASNTVIYSTTPSAIGQLMALQYNSKSQRVEYKLDSGWKVVGLLEPGAARQKTDRLSRVFILISASMIAAILILPINMSLTVLRPIKKLMTGIARVQEGELDFHIESDSRNEFAVVIHNFNYMLTRLRRLIRLIVEKENQNRRAQFSALQAKLDPHFLFNTLDMIHWMLIIDGNENIADTIVLLSKMLRYSISHKDDYVTLMEDMEQYENYLSILNLYYENRLTHQIEMDTSVAMCKIPKLLLQPLIENSIKYGFGEMNRNGHIIISVQSSGDNIVMVVEDNGKGIEKDKLDNIRKQMNSPENKGGYGIQLVHTRTKYIYGENRASVSINSHKGGTVIIVTVAKVI